MLPDTAITKVGAAILGPGNIGIDLIYKILRRSSYLDLKLVAGIVPQSKGLQLAANLGIETSADGIHAILRRGDISIVFDATGAEAHKKHAPLLKAAGKKTIDLTPAAVGPYVVPVVNLDEHIQSDNINLITCGGQATIPIVKAITRVVNTSYAEIVATIASKSAGPGTRQNIDEFTETTAHGIVMLGGTQKGKAIILLNPAEPPIIMNNTVYARIDRVDRSTVTDSVKSMVIDVQKYVPGYRLKMLPVFDDDMVTIMIEVEGGGDYLPKYSGNLDIMNCAALAVGEKLAANYMLKQNR